MGKLGEAIDEYRRVFDRAPAVGIALARLLILHNLRRPAAQRDWAEVEQVLQQTARSMPNSTPVTIWQAEALVAQGQPGAPGSCSKQPGTHIRTGSNSGLPCRNWPIDTRRPRLPWPSCKKPRTAWAIVSRCSSLGPSTGRLVAARSSRELALLERDIASRTEGDQEPLLRVLAGAYLRIGDAGSADRILSRLVERNPGDLGLRFTQFEQALRAGDDAAMGQILNQIRVIEDDPQTSDRTEGTLWRCGRARYLLWLSRNRARGTIEPNVIEEIRLLLAEVEEQRPSWRLDSVHPSRDRGSAPKSGGCGPQTTSGRSNWG